jgi:hypothetical protein
VQRDDPSRRKIAIVATAHYLARVAWSLMKKQTLWVTVHGNSKCSWEVLGWCVRLLPV